MVKTKKAHSVVVDKLKLRKELYLQTVHHVNLLLGKDSKPILAYKANYESTFDTKWTKSTKDLLIKRIEGSKIVFMGDFHALQQSQKTHLRILKSLKNKKIILAVECIQMKDQKHLDHFLAGKITEGDFLRNIRWQKTWGFPWENYKPLFRWAQKNQVRMLALNKITDSLVQRDKQAAKIVGRSVQQNKDFPHFVIYGDLHISKGHLPQKIKQQANVKYSEMTSLFQNSEKIYFEAVKLFDDSKVDVVQLNKNEFCIVNVPPWVKWQNYLLYLENQIDSNLEDDMIELSDYVAQLQKVIADDLGVEIKTNNISVITGKDIQLIKKISLNYSEADKKWLLAMVKNNDTFYLPEWQLGFLGRPTVNFSAEIAMSILHSQLSKAKKFPMKMPEQFKVLIWINAVNYFGSKLINPKRKTDTISDIKQSLMKHSPEDYGTEVLKLALQQKMNDLLYLSQKQKLPRSFVARSKTSYRMAAKILGGILGEKLYFGFSNGRLSRSTLMSLISKTIDFTDFDLIYNEILEIIENLPEPFLSKTEKI